MFTGLPAVTSEIFGQFGLKNYHQTILEQREYAELRILIAGKHWKCGPWEWRT